LARCGEKLAIDQIAMTVSEFQNQYAGIGSENICLRIHRGEEFSCRMLAIDGARLSVVGADGSVLYLFLIEVEGIRAQQAHAE